MGVDRLRLIDSTFAHSKLGYCSDYQTSDKFVWDRETPLDECEHLVYTDMCLNQAVEGNKAKNVAWLIEPMCIANQNYDLIKQIQGRFSKILTHDKSLLDLGTPYEFVPFGCCWIPKENQRIYDKTKDVSIIASSKSMTNGHKFRYKVINEFKDKLDVYGRGWNPIEHKVEGLVPYKFSVVIENCKREGWFTEKLIDCFATGTIPIYWGAPDIGNFFNLAGILQFDTMVELSNILNMTSGEVSTPMSDAIKDNFERITDYLLPDDWVYDKVNYPSTLM